MRRIVFNVAAVVVVVLFLFTAAQAQAPTAKLYVTNLVGGQILTVDSSTGQTAVLFNGSATPAFRPQGITYGPDGKLYVSVPESNQIVRLDANAPTTPETVYGSPVAGEPTRPQGVFFNGGYDLYFTTDTAAGTGVWKISGVGAIPAGGPFPRPVHVLTLSGTSTAGLAFGLTGNLLFVNQTAKSVMQSAAPFTSATTLISGLTAPFGVAVNSTGDIFVSDAGTTRSIRRFGADGSAKGTYVTFPTSGVEAPDSPFYLRFDLADNLFVVTGENSLGDDGRIWRIAPPGGTVNRTLLADLDTLCRDFSESRNGCTSGTLKADTAIGIAVPPTSTSITLPYSSSLISELFNYGGDSIQFKFLGSVLTGFNMVVTKTQVLPADLASQLQNATLFPQGTACIQFSHEGGFCDTYTVAKGTVGSPAPAPNTDFTGQIEVKMGFFTENAIQQPSLGHAPGSNPFIDDIILDFAGQLTPGADPGIRGGSDGFSRFVPLNKPTVLTNGQPAFFCGFSSPVPPPPVQVFNLGSTVPVKFQLTTGPNCTGSFITDATARLTLVRVDTGVPTLEPVQASTGNNVLNFFRLNGHQYVYNLSTKGLPAGTYIITVWGDKFTPQTDSFALR
jgi:hypothetical protein